MAQGFTVWLTGLSGAGKSTIAAALAARLGGRVPRVEVLDSAELRGRLGDGLGYSREDRARYVQRIAFTARLLSQSGAAVIVAATSPHRDAREQARAEIDQFVEVFVRCPVEELMVRDPKGLYARALGKEIDHFPGVSEVYEPPVDPDVVVDRELMVDDTHLLTPEEAVTCIVRALEARGLLPARSAGLRRCRSQRSAHPAGAGAR